MAFTFYSHFIEAKELIDILVSVEHNTVEELLQVRLGSAIDNNKLNF